MTATLGAGAMGEVYRAHDARVRRDVAIKILHEAFGADRERLARFEREARVLASLNHPGIAHLYGVEESGAVRAIVMELVNGPTLAERISRGPVPLNEVVSIGHQLALALGAAHERGIIHRDLKPANIKLTDEGVIKVLDFGLARAMEEQFDGVGSGGPTMTATSAGVVLGTAAYMSPEQACGRVVDRRTDIWAFGCVLYELLTGRRAFEGDTAPDVIAAVLGREVDLRRVSPSLPGPILRVLTRCLEKDPSRRLHDIADARLEFDDVINGRLDATSVSRSSTVSDVRWRTVAIGSLLALAGVVVVMGIRSRATSTAEPGWSTTQINAVQLTSYGGAETAPAIAPDGRTFVFVSDRGTTPDIWLRQVSGGEPIRLTTDASVESDLVYAPDGESIYFTRSEGSDSSIWRIGALGSAPQRLFSNARRPAPSPDGRSLAYYTADEAGDSALVLQALVGGSPQVLAKGPPDASLPRWSRDGRWLAFVRTGLFAPRNLFVVDAANGQVRQATQFTRGDEGISSHDWLPDNRQLAVSFVPPDSGGEHDLGVLDVTTGALSRLTLNLGGQAFQRVSVSADGSRLLATSFLHRHSLWKVPLGSDPAENGRLATQTIDDTHDPAFIVASRDGGTLLFAGTSTGARNVWTIQREGRALPRQVTTIAGTGVQHPAISPDGGSVAFAARINGTSDIWLQQMDGANLRPLTNDDGADSWPTWSPDGRTIAFSSAREGRPQTWQVAAAGGAVEKLWDGLLRGDWIRRPDGVGTWLVTWFPGGIRLYDYERRAVVWEKSIPTAAAMPVFSPDGRSISVSVRDGYERDAIWILDAATGEGKLAVRLPERFRVEFRASWVDGGKALIVNRMEETSHVVLFDRFWDSGAKR